MTLLKGNLNRIIIILAIALVSGINSISAQIKIIKNLNVESGLVYSQVLCAYQDADGYLWYGTTSGLSR